MNKFLIGILAIVILGAATQSILPWWSVAGLAAIVGVWVGGSGWKGFGYGFVAGVLLWGGSALWQSIANDGILAARMGQAFNMPSFALVLVTMLIGGLVAGLGALCGSLARSWLAS